MGKKNFNTIIAFLLVLMPVAANATIGTTAIGIALSYDASKMTCLDYNIQSPHCGTNLQTTPLLPTIVTSLVNTTTCEDVEFDADISVTNFINVGSVSLALSYDVSKLTYLGYENLNSALEDGALFVNARNGVVYVSWMSINGATIGDGILMSLRFSGASENSLLSWYTSRCEYANVLGMVLPDSYQDGMVTISAAPNIISQPSNKTIYEGSNTSFAVGATGGALSYQWQSRTGEDSLWTDLENGGHYGNVTSSMLNIYSATFDMNGCFYRCEVNGLCGSKYSNSAMLTVGWIGDFYQVTLTVSPENGGEVTGEGLYCQSDSVVITATANTGWHFVNWTKGGLEVSNSQIYSFIVTESVAYVANFEQDINQTTSLVQGWNWFSTYIEADDLLEQLEAGLDTVGISINTQGAVLVYRNGRWIGGLNGIENNKGYKIKTSAPVEVTIAGQIVDPASCPITITEGSNWIGYPLSETRAVANALAGFTPSNGDVIMTQGGTTVYRNGHWLPATFVFEPGKGYIYKSTSPVPKTLIFSNDGTTLAK